MKTRTLGSFVATLMVVALVTSLNVITLPQGATVGDGSSSVVLEGDGRLHLPPDDGSNSPMFGAGGNPSSGSTGGTTDSDDWGDIPDVPRGPILRDNGSWRRDIAAETRLLANEQLVLSGDVPDSPVPITAAILAIPIEFTATETLAHQVHNADGSECITVTDTFAGPLHGQIGYPGGSVSDTIDNQTVFYSSTESEDYAALIFGREGLTTPLRAGDPNVNDGAGADISGLTVQTYFDDQSDGTVEITGTVAPWVPLPSSEAYYGIDRCAPGFSSRAQPDEQLANLADLTVSGAERLKAMGGEYGTYEFWKQFDRNGDSVVDSLWIIHSGRGQEYGGGAQGEAALWSRASSIMAYADYRGGYVIHDNGTPTMADDVRLGAFTILPEDSDIGVLIEEFGHSYFDLPDLYTIDMSNSVGWWAPMSAGIYGGELGGSRPVNMPLWFRQVADCDGEPCGWADPIKAVTYTTPSEIVIVGQAGEPAGGEVPEGEYAGETIYEGLRIDLPIQVEQAPNMAGTGGGAYSGTSAGVQNTLTRDLDLTDVTGPVTLTFGSHWRIPYIFGYGYLEVAEDGGAFETQPDLDDRFTDDNPMGVNDGWGLTRDGEGDLRFDLTPFAGKAISIRLRYFTYQGTPGTGWWVDDLVVAAGEGEDVATVISDDFEGGLADWEAQGWGTVPYELTHPHHYLVEWRNDHGFDKSLKTAYSVNYSDESQLRVDRVPTNVPGALVMYRNLKYPLAGTLEGQLTDPPSLGPKYGLLVADTNYWPVLKGGDSLLPGSLQSLDAALALQDQADFELEHRDRATGQLVRTEAMAGSPGVTRLDDALGYYPGYYSASGSPMAAEAWDEDASLVIPSRDGVSYSTRVTWPDKTRPHPLDGVPAGGGHYFGTGNPGDENAQWGVHIEVVDQADDGSWGAVRVYNGGADYSLEAASLALPGHETSFDVEIVNRGSVTATVQYTVTLPVELEALDDDLTWSGEIGPASIATGTYGVRIPLDITAADGPFVAQAVFDDSTDLWARSAEMHSATRLFVPLALHGVLGEEPEPEPEP